MDRISRMVTPRAKNGVELDPDDDAAYDLVVAVASGSPDDVDRIAESLASFVRAA